MCGIAGIIIKGEHSVQARVPAMLQDLLHRGPDDGGVWIEGHAELGNRRLAILDLSPLGHQPMTTPDGRFVITYNGEVYNYLELRQELGGSFLSGTDTEVVLEAFARWGPSALDRFNGMFAFAIWDRQSQTLFLARDRFGVKPVFYAEWQGDLYFASEIKALAGAGVPLEADPETWALYLTYGVYDHSERTFFKGVYRLPPGHYLKWKDARSEVVCWYDLAERVAGKPQDNRSDSEVASEYSALMMDAVRLRFRSDVPVGVCLSGGLDSSTLVGTLHQLYGLDAEIHTYHYATGDPDYDETPWVKRLLERSRYPLHIALLKAEQVPDLAEEVSYFQEEPFGGFPTLAMVRLFELARETGSVVLLGGEGLDEQWGGYDYYERALTMDASQKGFGPVQGSISSPTRPECLTESFRRLARPVTFPAPFHNPLKDLQYRDLRFVKIPRALRFTDRASSQMSRELREPFLDYRLVELAFRQPADRLIRNGERKYLLRRIARQLLPDEVAEAPKRPVQTPQREWLRGSLRDWVEACLNSPDVQGSGWFDIQQLKQNWSTYLRGESDNSFFVFQWISVALFGKTLARLRGLTHCSTAQR